MTIRSSIERTTAGDLMTRNVFTLDQTIPAVEAAELLLDKSIGGAPVVDEQGRCVGVFSVIDFTRVVKYLANVHEQPQGCPFQQRHHRTDGSDVTVCVLPAGLCSLQMPADEEDTTRQYCKSPHEIVVEWQSLQPQLSPNDPVKRWMSTTPITIGSDATLTECAQRMTNAKIHRLVIVDDERHVVGLVTSLDLLKAIARHR